jgi:lysophospholipase L1-like esterase
MLDHQTRPVSPPAGERRPVIRRRLAFVACGLVAGLIISEIALRLIFPQPRGYFLLPPNSRNEMRIPASMLVDMPSVARHSINAQGVRGDPLGPDQEYRILAIGGSTTACGALDGRQTWVAQLQAILNERSPKRHVWVGNLGKDGLNTRHHLVAMSRFLPQHPKVDTILLLVGINDLLGRLAADSQFKPLTVAEIESNSNVLARTFAIMPRDAVHKPWYRKLALWRLAARLREELRVMRRPPPDQSLAQARAQRRNARVMRSKLPDLGPALREYEQNLQTLIARGRDRGARIVFLTQPVLWKPEGTTPEETQTLMFGLVGPELRRATEYYAVPALAEGMVRYNEVLRRVCRENNVECIDLAAKLKPDLSVFYDDCHFNISGARQVAQLVADHLLARPPFAPAEAGGLSGR